jgi:hypothetical protein
VNSAGDKVDYWHTSAGRSGLFRGTAYLDQVEGDRAWGTEKHSDEPLELHVVDGRWIQTEGASNG